MPRHNKRARGTAYNKLSFKEVCYKAGITPLQRIKMIRYLKLQRQSRQLKNNEQESEVRN